MRSIRRKGLVISDGRVARRWGPPVVCCLRAAWLGDDPDGQRFLRLRRVASCRQ